MTKDELKKLFESIKVWGRGDERAPHKPLLIIYALAKCSRGEDQLIPYLEVDVVLKSLLLEFGPPRKSFHTEYPFWRLRNDGIWALKNAENVELRQSNTDAKKSELIKHNISGGFTAEIYKKLRKNQGLIKEIARSLLERSFPESIHEDILQAVGLDISTTDYTKSIRDPEFRSKVITAYEHKCAVCGYNVQLANKDVGLEAAHIKWHQAGGPDTENNGLSLCSLHHKLFDRGVFTISEEYRILVSQKVHGSGKLADYVLSYHSQPIREAQSRSFFPRHEYLKWHFNQVFEGPARHRQLEVL